MSLIKTITNMLICFIFTALLQELWYKTYDNNYIKFTYPIQQAVYFTQIFIVLFTVLKSYKECWIWESRFESETK